MSYPRRYYARDGRAVPDFASPGVTRMTQEPLFKDVLRERLIAIGADVDAAGGEKVVGTLLWPKLSPDTAARRMANALNPKQRHVFTDDEVWVIKQKARLAVGRSQLHELECSSLEYEGKWLTSEDIKIRRRKRRAALLAELVQLDREDE